NGADYVIALTSLNKNSELSPITLAEEIKGLDLIIGQGGGNPAASAVHEGDTLVVYGDSTLKSVGMAEIDLNSKTAGVQSYTIESSVLSANDDRDTALALEKIIAEQEAAQKDIICQFAFSDKESDNNRENAIGSMAAAAIRPITGAEAAIVLEDLWVGVPLDGIISMEKLFKGVDESSLAVTVSLTGAEIKALLEESLSAFNEEGITPIYFNGLGFKGNIKGEKGSRISEITINGEAADLNKTYLIALDSRLLGEDSEYSSLKNSKAINSYGLLSEAIMRYMRAFEKNGKLEIGINKAVAYGGEENPPTAPIKKEEPKKSEEPKNSAPPRAEEKIPPREEKPPTVKEKTYTVKMGDTLTKISKSIYGTIEYWDEIYNANRDVLKNSEDIRVGMVLRLPA
ncbi:MAG: 5'-nucleotidase C-terminal domain-containing protein, partial [Oscillospiraceae bacterium]